MFLLSKFHTCKFMYLCFLQRYSEASKQRLDRAILTFFQNFRKSYVGDQAMHSSKVINKYIIQFYMMVTCHICLFSFQLQQLYARLSELLGLNDHLQLLNVIVSKIATNLKCYTEVKDWVILYNYDSWVLWI